MMDNYESLEKLIHELNSKQNRYIQKLLKEREQNLRNENSYHERNLEEQRKTLSWEIDYVKTIDKTIEDFGKRLEALEKTMTAYGTGVQAVYEKFLQLELKVISLKKGRKNKKCAHNSASK